MTRQTAYKILIRYLSNPTLLKHSLATEITMRALAPRFGEDVEEWGITGLLHDADYEKSKGHPEQHGLLLFQLEPNSIPTVIEHSIKAHNYEETHVIPESKMDWALACCDELTGVIFTLTQKQKENTLTTLTPAIVMQALQEKNLPKEVKEKISLCETKLDIPLTDFVAITLSAIQQIAPELGL